MDSNEFWEGDGDGLIRISNGLDDVWTVSVEELYQHFAERFRRENEVVGRVKEGVFHSLSLSGGKIEEKTDA